MSSWTRWLNALASALSPRSGARRPKQQASKPRGRHRMAGGARRARPARCSLVPRDVPRRRSADWLARLPARACCRGQSCAARRTLGSRGSRAAGHRGCRPWLGELHRSIHRDGARQAASPSRDGGRAGAARIQGRAAARPIHSGRAGIGVVRTDAARAHPSAQSRTAAARDRTRLDGRCHAFLVQVAARAPRLPVAWLGGTL